LSIRLFEEKRDELDAHKCRDNAIKFDRPTYKKLMKKHIENVTGSFS